MHAGEGDIDIHVDAWLPNQKDFHQKYVVEEGTVVYSEKHYAGSSGFCGEETSSSRRPLDDGARRRGQEAAKGMPGY